MQLQALTRAQRKLYDETVSGTHHREVTLEVLRVRDGARVRSLTNQFLGGSVQGDIGRSPVEVLECDVLDEAHVLDWANGEHRKFKLRVVDARFVPALDEWVEEIVFTGPVWNYQRTGDVVHLVAEGSELLAMGSVRNPDTWPAKTKATKVIRELLSAAGAEGRDMVIPNLSAKLPREVTIGVRRGKKKGRDDDKKKGPKRQIFRATDEETYWPLAERIVEALDRDLFADSRGRFVMAGRRNRPTVRFDERTLLGPVVEKRGSEGETTNTWVILGHDPKGPRKRVRARVAFPKKHPLSAFSLRWNGKPREVSERIENKHLRTKKQAIRLGERKRDQKMRQLVEYEAQGLPIIPWLRPYSSASLPTAAGRVSASVPRWTLPLGPGPDPLVIGANRRRG